MKTTPRPIHGGLNYVELKSLGLTPDGILDFSVSINPFAPASAQRAIQTVDPAAYPDPDCLELRDALSKRLEITPDHILVGNGSTELIHLLPRVYLNPGDKAAIFTPTFGEYEAACRLQGIEPAGIDADQDEGFHWNQPAALEFLTAEQPSLVFLCNPNNPTGLYLGEDVVRRIAEALRGKGLLVLDEAYFAFAEKQWDSRSMLTMGNVVLLRSMTKDYGLTGLRLGYLLAPPEVIEQVRGFQYSWSVNALAQAAGIAALEHCENIEEDREAVCAGKQYLLEEMRNLGLECTPSAANFLLVKVGDAADLRLNLLINYGICVRDCTSFGLPGHIRVGVRRLEDCQRLIVALRKISGMY